MMAAAGGRFTCVPNGVDPRAWLVDVLARIADMTQQRLHELLPWNWRKQQNMAPSAA
jgi:transposase